MPRVRSMILGVFLFALTAGCANDPYSQRRIALRHENFAETIRSVQHREDSGHGRVERAQRAAEQWRRQDEIKFAEELEQVGDRAW